MSALQVDGDAAKLPSDSVQSVRLQGVKKLLCSIISISPNTPTRKVIEESRIWCVKNRRTQPDDVRRAQTWTSTLVDLASLLGILNEDVDDAEPIEAPPAPAPAARPLRGPPGPQGNVQLARMKGVKKQLCSIIGANPERPTRAIIEEARVFCVKNVRTKPDDVKLAQVWVVSLAKLAAIFPEEMADKPDPEGDAAAEAAAAAQAAAEAAAAAAIGEETTPPEDGGVQGVRMRRVKKLLCDIIGADPEAPTRSIIEQAKIFSVKNRRAKPDEVSRAQMWTSTLQDLASLFPEEAGLEAEEEDLEAPAAAEEAPIQDSELAKLEALGTRLSSLASSVDKYPLRIQRKISILQTRLELIIKQHRQAKAATTSSVPIDELEEMLTRVKRLLRTPNKIPTTSVTRLVSLQMHLEVALGKNRAQVANALAPALLAMLLARDNEANWGIGQLKRAPLPKAANEEIQAGGGGGSGRGEAKGDEMDEGFVLVDSFVNDSGFEGAGALEVAVGKTDLDTILVGGGADLERLEADLNVALKELVPAETHPVHLDYDLDEDEMDDDDDGLLDDDDMDDQEFEMDMIFLDKYCSHIEKMLKDEPMQENFVPLRESCHAVFTSIQQTLGTMDFRTILHEAFIAATDPEYGVVVTPEVLYEVVRLGRALTFWTQDLPEDGIARIQSFLDDLKEKFLDFLDSGITGVPAWLSSQDQSGMVNWPRLSLALAAQRLWERFFVFGDSSERLRVLSFRTMRVLHSVPGDGNCGFVALTEAHNQLMRVRAENSAVDQSYIRERIVDFLKDSESEKAWIPWYEPLLGDQSIEKVAADLLADANDGLFRDAHAAAYANIFSRRVHILGAPAESDWYESYDRWNVRTYGPRGEFKNQIRDLKELGIPADEIMLLLHPMTAEQAGSQNEHLDVLLPTNLFGLIKSKPYTSNGNRKFDDKYTSHWDVRHTVAGRKLRLQAYAHMSYDTACLGRLATHGMNTGLKLSIIGLPDDIIDDAVAQHINDQFGRYPASEALLCTSVTCPPGTLNAISMMRDLIFSEMIDPTSKKSRKRLFRETTFRIAELVHNMRFEMQQKLNPITDALTAEGLQEEVRRTA